MYTSTVLQPHLGRAEEIYKPESNLGFLALAKITKIFHMYGTVEVQVIRTNALIGSSTDDGKFGARVVVSTSHYDNSLNTSSGVIEPMQEGQLVILAFLDGQRQQPIIIGSLPNTWENSMNIMLDTRYTGLQAQREYNKYLRVFPSQAYLRVDGIGGVEFSLPNKSFIKIDIDEKDEMVDGHGLFDHTNLSEKDPNTQSTRQGVTQETNFPSSILAVHRSSSSDDVTTWTKFFVDKTGKFRVTRDSNDGALTFLELSQSGKIRLTRQKDSSNHDEGTANSSISINEDGTVELTNNSENSSSMIVIGEDDVQIKCGSNNVTVSSSGVTVTHHTGSYISFTEDGDIIIKSHRYLKLNQGGA